MTSARARKESAFVFHVTHFAREMDFLDRFSELVHKEILSGEERRGEKRDFAFSRYTAGR